MVEVLGVSGSSRFESLILSHHARFTCECSKEDINDDSYLRLKDFCITHLRLKDLLGPVTRVKK